MLKIHQFVVKKCIKSYSSAASASAAPAEAESENLTKEKSLNHIQLIGRVGQDPKIGGIHKDPESENTDNKHRKVVMFSLATNGYMGLDDNGFAKNRTDWHRICVMD